MERSIERWAGMVPEEVAKGSEAQMVYALRDAKSDISELYDALTTLWKAVDAGTETNSDLWTDAALKYRAAIAKATT